MKFSQKILVILILNIFTAAFVFAQTKDWQTISPEGEEFSVEMPNQAEIELPNDKKNKYKEGFYKSIENDTYYLIRTSKDKKWHLTKTVLNYAEANNARKESFIIGKIEGDKYLFKDLDGFYNTVVMIFTNNKQHIFHIASLLQDNPSVERMVNSIAFKNNPTETKIIETDDKVNEETSTFDSESDDRSEDNKKPEKSGSGVGSGVGSGGGFGVGDGTSDGRRTPNPPPPPAPKKPKPIGPTTGIQILTKPRPGYTELSRQYNISGIVKVRVTFLRSGRISSVSPIQRLPFGLTSKAIAAAHQIKFIPPMRNGVKYNVSKVVVFNFLIY